VSARPDLAPRSAPPPPFDFEETVREPARREPVPPAAPRALHPLQAELIAVAGGALLFVSLAFLKWFGTGAVVGRFASRAGAAGAESGWHELTVLRWLVLATVALALVPLFMRLWQRWMGPPRRIHAVVAFFGSATALLLVYRVLIDLPDPNRVVDQKAGAILALVGAVGVAVGGLESARGHAPAARADAAPGPGRDRRQSRQERRLAREIARINA
jgi:hypothetical protein